jgi:uncharacterized protein (DUF305 family)
MGGGAAALLCALAAACSSAPRGEVGAAPRPAAAARDEAAAAVARARADSARHPYTAADIHFMTVMIGHHSQAVTIGRWAPTHGASPAVLRLAERIVNAQEDEIGTMRRWLQDRRQPVPEPGAAPAMHHGSDHGAGHGGAAAGGAAAGHGAAMPGMLSESQLQQLDRARGEEFDRLFLTFMIQHHRGAVAMVQQLFGSYGAGQDETVFKFATDVNVDQNTEIARMQRMLFDLELERRTR